MMSLGTIEATVELFGRPLIVYYVDNLMDIITESIWFNQPCFVLSFDKALRNVDGMVRLGNPRGQGDFAKLTSYKVMRSAIRNDEAYEDVSLLFDNWEMSNEQQAAISATAYQSCAGTGSSVEVLLTGQLTCTSAYDAACAWLNDNTDFWEPWIRCTDCPAECKEDSQNGYCLQTDCTGELRAALPSRLPTECR